MNLTPVLATAATLGLLLAPPPRVQAQTQPADLFPPEVLGQRAISYDYSGLRTMAAAPAPGVHPRIYFNAEDLPDIRNRLTGTTAGIEAFKQIQLYTDLLRNGRASAWDSKPNSFKLMPDGTTRANAGLYDKSAVYNQLVAGNTAALDAMIAANDSTGLYVLGSSMALEAFECLVLEEQPGIAERQANLATALATWAADVLTDPDFPGAPGATFNGKRANQHRFGGHHTALAYDMVFNAMTQAQRDTVRQALARLVGGYFSSDASNTEYTGVGCTAEGVATNWVAINSLKLIAAMAIEGEVTAADAGYSSQHLADWFARAMGSYHKFLTYGWFKSGSGLEGQGKNYLFGAHMVPFARRGWNFFAHPHVRAYAKEWLPASTQPFGYSFILYDLLGGSGPNPEKGRMFMNGLDYIALKWMYPDSTQADFAWRNFINTEYKDASGQWRTFPDFREGKFSPRSIYFNMLLPAAVYATDVSSTSSWTAHNTEAQGALDYVDPEGGSVIARSGYDPEAAALLFHVRQDFGGHTFADRNTFTLSALGRLFINYNSGGSDSMIQEARYQSIIEVDGLSMKLTNQEGDKQRIPSKLAAWTPLGGSAVFATGDATYAYSQEWRWNAYTTTPTVTSGFTLDQNSHNTFRRAGNKIPEAFGNTPFRAFPHWVNPGQFEGIQAKSFNPMRQVYRTIGLVRGAKPYVLVADDVRKDDTARTYKWFASVPKDLTIVTGGSLPAGADPATDVVLAEPAATGNRRLLVRILRADGTPAQAAGTTGSTLAYLETVASPTTAENWNRLVIERGATVAPNYRILLFPFREGDTLPATSLAGNTLNVTIGAQADTFNFVPRTASVAGQTVTMSEFTLSRNGSTILDYRNQIEPAPVRAPSAAQDTLPAAPTNLTAASQPAAAIRLNWTDNTTTETAWIVERSEAGGANWKPIATTLPANTATHLDTATQPGHAYDYRVRCVSPAGLSDYAVVTGAVADANGTDTSAPAITAPSALSVPATGANGAIVNFTTSALDNVDGAVATVNSPASGTLFPIGTTPVTTTATDAAGNAAELVWSVTVLPLPPTPWTVSQVGSGTSGTNGAVSYDFGTGAFTFQGRGGDIWSGTNENFTFAHIPWNGDGVFTARVVSFSSGDSAAKAGIMIRESLALGAKNSFTYMSRAGHGFHQNKTTTNGNVSPTQSSGRGIPEWIRLVRSNNTTRSFFSGDGITWTQVGAPVTNTLSGTNIRAGLAVGPRTGTNPATVVFDNISFLTSRQSWREEQFGSADNIGDANDHADPDGDGLTNLHEYATGTDPWSPQSSNRGLLGRAGNFLTLTFNRVPDPSLTYLVRGADSLGGPWQGVWQSTGTNNLAGPVTATDNVELSAGTVSARFLSLGIHAP